jgi:hypothetical protein
MNTPPIHPLGSERVQIASESFVVRAWSGYPKFLTR